MLEGKAKASGFSGIDITGGLFVLDKTNKECPSVINLRCGFFLLFAVKIQGAIEVLLHQSAQVCGSNNFYRRAQSQ